MSKASHMLLRLCTLATFSNPTQFLLIPWVGLIRSEKRHLFTQVPHNFLHATTTPIAPTYRPVDI